MGNVQLLRCEFLAGRCTKLTTISLPGEKHIQLHSLFVPQSLPARLQHTPPARHANKNVKHGQDNAI